MIRIQRVESTIMAATINKDYLNTVSIVLVVFGISFIAAGRCPSRCPCSLESSHHSSITPESYIVCQKGQPKQFLCHDGKSFDFYTKECVLKPKLSVICSTPPKPCQLNHQIKKRAVEELVEGSGDQPPDEGCSKALGDEGSGCEPVLFSP